MNLEDDLKTCIVKWFSNKGITFNCDMPVNDLLERFVYSQARLIRPTPRRVFISDSLSEKLETSQIDVSKINVINEIKAKLERGEDVFPHLSAGVLNANSKDDLLNDWGIHHLHLSNLKSRPGQVMFDRTGPVLFVRIEATNAYIIDVRVHGRAGEEQVFAKQELLGICKQNWPQLLEPYALKGARLNITPTDDLIEKMRRAGICTMAEIDGQAYFPMGGGLTSARTNVSHCMQADKIISEVREIENRLKELKMELGGEYSPPFNFDFKLDIDSYKFVVIQYPEKLIAVEIPF